MTADLPRWMFADPARVYERIEAQEQAKAARKAEKERDREELFKEPTGDDKKN